MRKRKNHIQCVADFEEKRDFGYIVYTEEFLIRISLQYRKDCSGVGCKYSPASLDIDGAILKGWNVYKKVEEHGSRDTVHLILDTSRGEVDLSVYHDRGTGQEIRVRVVMEDLI